jgi:mannosyltransferase OCH1-like enzyme
MDYLVEWGNMNPDWTCALWLQHEIEDSKWINQPVLDHLRERDDRRGSIEYAVQVADVVGYELIYQFGGVYLNVDIEPVRSLAVLHDLYVPEGESWVAREDDMFVVGAAMGGSPGDPFYGSVIEALYDRYFAAPYDEMNQTTGPRLLTDVWRSWRSRVTALPVVAFNPWHWSTIPPGGTAEGRGEPPSGTIGIHHWGHRQDRRTNRIEGGTVRSSS